MSPSVLPPEFDELLSWSGTLDREQVVRALETDPPPVSPERKAALARQDELGVPASALSAFESRKRAPYRALYASGALTDPTEAQRFWGYVNRAAQALVQGGKLTDAEFEVIVAPLRAAGYRGTR